MNGSRYPQGLQGKYILLEVRTLAVADVFKAECLSEYRLDGL